MTLAQQRRLPVNGLSLHYRFDPDANRTRRPADCRPLLLRIAAPTLIARAALSPVLPRELADQMRAAIGRAAIVEIPGAYHHLTLDAPGSFASALRRFLESLD